MIGRIQIFTGYQASKDTREHQPLFPCVKLVRGRLVVSVLSDGFMGGFVVGSRLRATEVQTFRCYVYPTEEDAHNINALWHPDSERFRLESVPFLCPTLDAAMAWLMSPED